MEMADPFSRLPAEIIERFFGLSLNPNLALASPLFCSIVNTERIYSVFLLYAFFAPVASQALTWDNWREAIRLDDEATTIMEDDEHCTEQRSTMIIDQEAFYPIEYKLLSVEDRVELQRSIINRRWFTTKRIKSVLPRLQQLSWHQQSQFFNLLRRNYENGYRVPIEGNRGKEGPLVDSIVYQLGNEISGHLDVEDLYVYDNPLWTPTLHRNLTRFRRADKEDTFVTGPIYGWSPSSCCNVQQVSNDLLLRSCHSQDSLETLCLLVGSSMGEPQIMTSDFMSMDVLKVALKDAVSLANYDALRVLLRIVSERIDRSPNRRIFPPNDTTTAGRSVQLKDFVEPEIFRSAMSLPDPEDQKKILKVLCLTPFCESVIPRNDQALLDWLQNADVSLDVNEDMDRPEEGRLTWAQRVHAYMVDGNRGNLYAAQTVHRVRYWQFTYDHPFKQYFEPPGSLHRKYLDQSDTRDPGGL